MLVYRPQCYLMDTPRKECSLFDANFLLPLWLAMRKVHPWPAGRPSETTSRRLARLLHGLTWRTILEILCFKYLGNY